VVVAVLVAQCIDLAGAGHHEAVVLAAGDGGHRQPGGLLLAAGESLSSLQPPPQAMERVEMLRVEIIDTGVGIESHVMPHLFRQRGDSNNFQPIA
jgi:signal transduction histidine kinase